jgi:peptidoglycan/LPS O-acetylase OafA/YrhL
MTIEPSVAPPPGNPHFPLFEGMRAMAAVAIVAFHVAGANTVADGLRKSFDLQLAVGVPVFFLISGFLLYRPFVVARLGGRPVRVREFARRRVLRIVPAYWLALTVLAAYPGLKGVFTGDWWRYYFFLQIYDPSTRTHGLATAWMLCTEATFYLLLPFYAWVLSRPRLTKTPRAIVRSELIVLAVLAAGATAFRLLVVSDHYNLGYSLPATFDWLAVGMALAVLSAVPARPGALARRLLGIVRAYPSLSWLAALAVLSSCAVYNYTTGRYGPFAGVVIHLAWAVAAFFLLLPVVVSEPGRGLTRRFLALRPVVWLGVVSYGIYLWHIPLLTPTDKKLPVVHRLVELPAGRFLLLVNVLAVTIVLAAGSYYLVERPLLRLKERRRAAQEDKRDLALQPGS